MMYIFYALRPKQWIKNFFIFLPLIFGGKLFIFPSNALTVAAFVIFSLAASTVYLVNDIIDIEKDKLHPTKRLRPIASGRVSIVRGLVAASILGIFSLSLAFSFSIYFGFVILAYFAFNLAYSLFLKNRVIIDVFCIGVFFLLRIIAGSLIAEVRLSHWVIIMTVLLALFLGFGKRRQELELLKRKALHHRYVFTKYNLYFIDQMIAVITSSIVVSYMLYVVDPGTVKQVGGKYLLFSVPFVYYGIFRYLYLIHKIKKDGDPTRILLSDKMMQGNVVLWIVVCIVAIYVA
jgi:4-hydroxybenzoate polyprenyltransferase